MRRHNYGVSTSLNFQLCSASIRPIRVIRVPLVIIISHRHRQQS